MTEYKNILTKLIKDKATWRELKQELSKYNVHSTETAEKDTRAGKCSRKTKLHSFRKIRVHRNWQQECTGKLLSSIEKNRRVNECVFSQIDDVSRSSPNVTRWVFDLQN